MQQRAWTAWRRNLGLVVLIVSAVSAAPAQQIQVNSADPPAAEQGTVNLSVTIGGKGFKKGAAASFVLTGTEDPDGITVNSTTFVSSTTLVANITVADTATISKFDIKVRNSDGRIGKGTELFSVLAKGSGGGNYVVVPTVSVLEMQNPATSAPFHIHSDGGGSYVGYSLASTGKKKDELLSQVYTGSGDWTVDTTNAVTSPRSIYLDLRDGSSPIGQREFLITGRMLVRCVQTDNPATSEDESTFADGGLLVMNASNPKKTNCRLGLGYITVDGVLYFILMGPSQAGDSAWVTCTSFNADGSQCNSWQIEAGTYDAVLNPTGNPGKVAWLYRRDTHPTVDTKVGEYNVSFRFQVSRQ